MSDWLIPIFSALACTVGYGVLFNIRGIKLLIAGLGGGLAWALFLLFGLVTDSEPLRFLMVSIVSTTLAEIFARLLKTPVTTFCVVFLVSLIPGSALYHTTTAAFGNDTAAFGEALMHTLKLTGALAIGIVLVLALFRYVINGKKRRHLYERGTEDD